MSIEEQLERIAIALEGLSGTFAEAQAEGAAERAEGKTEAVVKNDAADKKKAAADKKKADAVAKKAEKAENDGPTKEQVRNALQDYIAIDGREVAIELLKEHADGAENLSQLEPEHFQAVLDAIKAVG